MNNHNEHNEYVFSSDLAAARQEIYETVKRLHANRDKPNETVRVKQSNDILEAYYKATGERPDERILNRLSDYIIVDILSNQQKSNKDILSKKQIKRRESKQVRYSERMG